MLPGLGPAQRHGACGRWVQGDASGHPAGMHGRAMRGCIMAGCTWSCAGRLCKELSTPTLLESAEGSTFHLWRLC